MKKIMLLLLSSIFAFAININTATKAELMEIKGIGEKKAEAILKYTKAHKDIKIADLKNVDGIGDALIENLTKDVKVSAKVKEDTKKVKEDTKKVKEDTKKVKEDTKKVLNK